MEQITVRPARYDELPALSALVERSFRALGASHYTPPEIDGALAHGLIRVDPRLLDAGSYFVAERAGVLCGCGGYSDEIPTVAGLPLPVPRAEVRAMFVDPRHAGKGVGRALLGAAERAIADAGYAQAYLVATQSGLAFYRGAGYTPLGEHGVPIPSGGRLTVTSMVRDLSDS